MGPSHKRLRPHRCRHRCPSCLLIRLRRCRSSPMRPAGRCPVRLQCHPSRSPRLGRNLRPHLRPERCRRHRLCRHCHQCHHHPCLLSQWHPTGSRLPLHQVQCQVQCQVQRLVQCLEGYPLRLCSPHYRLHLHPGRRSRCPHCCPRQGRRSRRRRCCQRQHRRSRRRRCCRYQRQVRRHCHHQCQRLA